MNWPKTGDELFPGRARELGFGAAPWAETEDFDHRIGEVKTGGNLPSNTFEIKKLTFDVLDRFAARTHQVMMWLEISIYPQGG